MNFTFIIYKYESFQSCSLVLYSIRASPLPKTQSLSEKAIPFEKYSTSSSNYLILGPLKFAKAKTHLHKWSGRLR